jgi:glutaredoxin
MNKNIEHTILTKAQQMLEKIKFNNDTFLIFGLDSCTYCKKTLEFVNKNSLQFKYYSMDKYYPIFIPILQKLSELDNKLNIDQSHRTFPVIFYNGKFVGGYSSLIEYKIE